MLNLTGADQSLAHQIQAYHEAWKELIRHSKGLSVLAIPTTLSWKVDSKATLFKNLSNLASRIEQVHIGTVNDRYIASAVFHDPFIHQIRILKILERRQGSDDPLGLDSIDYLTSDPSALESILSESGIVQESNDMHTWLSLRFGPSHQFEAKFVDHLVLDVAIKELALSNRQILSGLT